VLVLVLLLPHNALPVALLHWRHVHCVPGE
jgi:hypothetical protein